MECESCGREVSEAEVKAAFDIQPKGEPWADIVQCMPCARQWALGVADAEFWKDDPYYAD